jgi:hypothetical protein
MMSFNRSNSSIAMDNFFNEKNDINDIFQEIMADSPDDFCSSLMDQDTSTNVAFDELLKSLEDDSPRNLSHYDSTQKANDLSELKNMLCDNSPASPASPGVPWSPVSSVDSSFDQSQIDSPHSNYSLESPLYGIPQPDFEPMMLDQTVDNKSRQLSCPAVVLTEEQIRETLRTGGQLATSDGQILQITPIITNKAEQMQQQQPTVMGSAPATTVVKNEPTEARQYEPRQDEPRKILAKADRKKEQNRKASAKYRNRKKEDEKNTEKLIENKRKEKEVLEKELIKIETKNNCLVEQLKDKFQNYL